MTAQYLTESRIKRYRHDSREQTIHDSKCLFLRIPPGAPNSVVRSASWVVRSTHKGKTTRVTVGHWPKVPVEEARRERDKLLGIGSGLGVSVSEAITDYRSLVADGMKSGWQLEPYLKHFDNHCGKRKLATLSTADLSNLVKRYAEDRGSRSAARYLSTLRALFALALEHGSVERNPLLGTTSRVVGYRAQPRERVLSDDEIRQLWDWDHHHTALLRFLLLTGLRISEAQKGRRDGDRWIVPAKYSKNGKEHWVYLTDLALEQLETPFEHSATAVQAWLRRTLDSLEVQPRWTPHDLRRTAITRLNGIGVDPIVVERYVNHTLPKLMATYNQFEYEKERINAANQLAEHIRELLSV